MLQKEIEARLAQYQDPYLETDLYTAKAIKALEVSDHKIDLRVVLGYPYLAKDKMIASLKDWLAPVAGNRLINIQCATQIDAHAVKLGLPGLAQVKNIIAVASGKGGVGKSTIAINLALALAHEGAEVGILDADIYGPSQPSMLGTKGQKPVLSEGKLLPIKQHGLQSMSIGYLVDQHAPMVWRGPMIGKAMQQLLHDTAWQALDYLIVDLPPGTGDIQLTLCQKIPVNGAVIVTTPQDLALIDVKRACEMFNKLNVPILGIVENMSLYHCPACGHAERIFGAGAGEHLAEQYQVPLLGALPLDISIREMTDGGYPLVIQASQSLHAKLFYSIAHKVSAKLALQAKDYSSKFSNIIIENNKGVGG